MKFQSIKVLSPMNRRTSSVINRSYVFCRKVWKLCLSKGKSWLPSVTLGCTVYINGLPENGQRLTRRYQRFFFQGNWWMEMHNSQILFRTQVLIILHFLECIEHKAPSSGRVSAYAVVSFRHLRLIFCDHFKVYFYILNINASWRSVGLLKWRVRQTCDR